MVKLLSFFLLNVFIVLGSLAAEDAPPATLHEAEQALLSLQDRGAWEAGLDRLLAVDDDRVRFALQHLQDRKLGMWQDRPVFVPVKPSAEYPAAIYPIFADPAALREGLASVETVGRFREQRKARKAALKALTVIGLRASSPDVRRDAAQDLGNRQVVDAFPVLLDLSQSDPVESVRRAAAVAVALMKLDGNTGGEVTDENRIAAAAVLADNSAFSAIDRLRSLLVPLQENSETSNPKVVAAYQDALADLEWQQSIANWTGHLFAGLSFASILLLMALGLAITFGLMGVINMAHGEMLMIGCVTTWACYEFIGTHLPPEWFNWYYVLAFPISFLAAALTGILVEVLVLRHLYKRPLDSMLATIGIGFIIIQAVRSMVGENLAKQAPSWFSGGFELMTGVILPYNRLFIILVSLVAVCSVVALFRWTRFGLLLRATVQNREVARAMGINTRMVDMITFGLGSGIAGIAGWAIFLNTNPNPGMGQTYIVESFLVTVTGGVGNILGVVISALGIGVVTKLLEPLSLDFFSNSTWAWIGVLLMVIIFIMRRPGGIFPDKGRLADQADRVTGASVLRMPAWGGWAGLATVAVFGLFVVPGLHVAGVFSPEFVNKLGYISTFALVAIGMDLLWGYCGAMSLCQALFFAIGAYCMGFYLINTGPQVGGIPEALKVVMSDVSNPTPPWYLSLFETFAGSVVLGLILAAVVAFVIGMVTFRSRVKGVYFAILTQAITVGAFLAIQQNDLKMGGTNGLNFYDNILGFPLAPVDDAGPLGQTRFWLYIASFLALLLGGGLAFWLSQAGLGRVMLAIRDDETRLRFNGYSTWVWKTVVLVIAALLAAVAGMLYTPQKSLINPKELSAFASIMVVAWTAFGGRATVWGAALGAILISLLYDWITSFWPDGWMFVLGGIFVLVPLFLPGGLLSVLPMIFKPRPQAASVPAEATT